MGETAKSKEVKKKEVKKKDPPAKAEKPAEKAEKKDEKKAEKKVVKAKAEEKPEKPVKKDNKDTKAKAPEPKTESKSDKAKTTEASKKKKKEEKVVKEKVKDPESEEDDDDDTRKLQEGVVEFDDPVPQSASRNQPKGACAAEALDDDEGTKNGKSSKSSKSKLGQADRADRSRSRDKGRDEEKPKAAKAKDEKERDKGKSKDKPKAKEPEKQEKGKQEKPAKERHAKEESSYSSEESSGGAAKRRLKRRADAGLKPASGFSLAPPPAPEPSFVGPSPNPLAVLPSVPEPVQSLLGADVTSELLRMRQAVEAATGKPVEPRLRLDQKEEEQETKLKMTEELREGLLDPANQKQLLARTSLLSATLAEDGQVILRAPSKQSLKDAMSVLARVAHHCQWGCSIAKVGLLLREKPEQPVHTVLVRLAATSSRMQTQEGRVNQRQEKLRVGTDASQCQIALEPIAGISRKHLTITFEYDKGGCYVQDMSTNGTRLNGKRLPRPPYKHPMDARVRIFHGDELVLAITPEGEELGFVVNLFELSG